MMRQVNTTKKMLNICLKAFVSLGSSHGICICKYWFIISSSLLVDHICGFWMMKLGYLRGSWNCSGTILSGKGSVGTMLCVIILRNFLGHPIFMDSLKSNILIHITYEQPLKEVTAKNLLYILTL